MTTSRTNDPYDHMETEPASIANPIERARLVFQQWHTDEVTDGPAALDYANRLVDRLAEHGLRLFVAPQPVPTRVQFAICFDELEAGKQRWDLRTLTVPFRSEVEQDYLDWIHDELSHDINIVAVAVYESDPDIVELNDG